MVTFLTSGAQPALTHRLSYFFMRTNLAAQYALLASRHVLVTQPPDVRPAARGFDDGTWEIVDTPHDALIATPYDETADNSQASIPKNVSW